MSFECNQFPKWVLYLARGKDDAIFTTLYYTKQHFAALLIHFYRILHFATLFSTVLIFVKQCYTLLHNFEHPYPLISSLFLWAPFQLKKFQKHKIFQFVKQFEELNQCSRFECCKYLITLLNDLNFLNKISNSSLVYNF